MKANKFLLFIGTLMVFSIPYMVFAGTCSNPDDNNLCASERSSCRGIVTVTSNATNACRSTSGDWKDGTWMFRLSNGSTVFCYQPGTNIARGNQNVVSSVVLTRDAIYNLSKYFYNGYEHPVYTIDSKYEKYQSEIKYLVTQQLVWESVCSENGSKIKIEWKCVGKNCATNDYCKEISEYAKEVKNKKDSPIGYTMKKNGNTVNEGEITIGDKITLNLNKSGYKVEIKTEGDSTITGSNTTYTIFFKDEKKVTMYVIPTNTKEIGNLYTGAGQTLVELTLGEPLPSPIEINPTGPTCSSTCAGKTGDNLLACAANYCSTDSCFTTCVTDPGFSKCSVKTCKGSTTSNCKDSSIAEKQTCSSATNKTYYKVDCKEQSIVNYNDSLPITLTRGSGFGYTLTLQGNKTCTYTFETEKWKYDYAKASTSQKGVLTNILNNYKNISESYNSYNSSNASITAAVEEKVNGTIKKTEKELIAQPVYNHASSITKSASVISYQGNSIPKSITVKSENKTVYSLPNVCIEFGTGKIYADDTCKTNDILSAMYYTGGKADIGSNNVYVTTKKESSCLNDTNACYYSVGTGNATCTIKQVGETSTYKLEYTITNVVGEQYGISLTQNEINSLKSIEISDPENKIIYGTIADSSGEILTTCSKEIIKPQPEQKTCTSLYKPIEKETIYNYCSTNWQNDTAGYISEKGCIDDCSMATCKMIITDRTNVKNVYDYCIDNYIKDGYSSYAGCVSECFEYTGKLDYIYRPISLGKPFPDRTAGMNWIGKEEYITNDNKNPVLNNEAKAEYKIKLTSATIKEIKKQTASYNNSTGGNKDAYVDYVRSTTKYSETGVFYSKFINDDDISEGGFTKYFTCIRSEGDNCYSSEGVNK